MGWASGDIYINFAESKFSSWKSFIEKLFWSGVTVLKVQFHDDKSINSVGSVPTSQVEADQGKPQQQLIVVNECWEF